MQMYDDAEEVLKVIREYDGVLPYNDKVSPEIINRDFGMSKNSFKRAVGHLYKEGLIQQAFPELETYVTFTSPFWRLRVGDFRSYEEAGNALIQLKKEFPQMAREMRVVRDKIHIQIHQGFTE